jgi:hypothetical protein
MIANAGAHFGFQPDHSKSADAVKLREHRGDREAQQADDVKHLADQRQSDGSGTSS